MHRHLHGLMRQAHGADVVCAALGAMRKLSTCDTEFAADAFGVVRTQLDGVLPAEEVHA